MIHEKKTVALSSMVASALMTVGKLIVGLLTGSLGILSEALHSFLDFGATILTYMAVRVSDKPADAEHPYGHGKIESIAALAETALLFVTSLWIFYEAGHRLLAEKVEVETTWWSIAVIVASILIDISRARALKRVAKETKSQALEADALHFSSDVWSSAVVLLGLGFVAIGFPKGDALAAIGVSMFVCHAGWALGRRTVDTLIDAAPLGVSERITALMADVKGHAGVQRVRARPAGSVVYVDADVAVGRSLSQGQVAALREKIVERIRAEMPEADVTIAMHPLALDEETVYQRVMVIAGNRNANVHHITFQFLKGTLSISLDLEVEATRTICEAHELASQLEADIRAEFGLETEVETHIEPLQDRGLDGVDLSPEELALMEAQLKDLVQKTGTLSDAHRIRARQTEKGLVVIFHCRTEAQRSVAEVHDIIDALEHRIREAYPEIWRILVHAEPFKAR